MILQPTRWLNGGLLCHHPGFDPIALDVYDVYIVNNHGEELKAKAPPLIGYAMFQVEILTDAVSGHAAYVLSFIIMYICIFNWNEPDQLRSRQLNWEGAWFSQG